MLIPREYWTVFHGSDLPTVYREYAYSTDMGPVFKNGKIYIRTTAGGGTLFSEAEYSDYNYRLTKARKSYIVNDDFYKIRVSNRPEVAFYINTESYALANVEALDSSVILAYDLNKSNKITTNNKESKEIIQDFIYKINDSNKLTTQTEYDSIDEFFSEPIANDIKLDTIVICAVDTKVPIIKLEKVKNEEKTDFKFIVDITNDQGEEFMFKSIIKTPEQLGKLVQQTVDALKNYPQFVKYIDDLENCL